MVTIIFGAGKVFVIKPLDGRPLPVLMSVVPSSGRSTDDHAVALGALEDGAAKLEARRIKNRAAAASSRRRHKETFQALEALVCVSYIAYQC
jgi:hypothetical protein